MSYLSNKDFTELHQKLQETFKSKEECNLSVHETWAAAYALNYYLKVSSREKYDPQWYEQAPSDMG